MEVKELVLETLKSSVKPLKSGEIAEKSGVDKKNVDKALKILKADELVICPKRCFYSIK